MLENLSGCRIGQVEWTALDLGGNHIPALMVLTSRCIRDSLPKCDSGNASVAVELDDDTETMSNVKYIGDVHCECGFTRSRVTINPEYVQGDLDVSYPFEDK